MSTLDHPVAVRPWRPPTAVYPDRHEIARARDQEFPPTASGRYQVFVVNLEGAFLSTGALMEMVVPLAQAVRSGVYGPTALLIITSDDSTVEFLEALAIRHDLSLFVAPSPEKALSEARPIGALTATEMETLSLVRSSGGEITSSRIANLARIEPNAAVNRVSNLVRKGYLCRRSRPRSEGDAFVHLVSTAETTISAASLDPPGVPSSQPEFSIPEDVREGVLLLAEVQGSKPGEVLLRAWREFLSRHRELLNAESKEVGRMIRESDTDGLANYASRYAGDRAKQAASRAKRQRS
jgi:DNA-binding MarR family transcriptional regulator